MDLLDDFSAGLMDTIGMNAGSIFGELPDLPGASQAPAPEQFNQEVSNEPNWDQAEKGGTQIPQGGKDGSQWVPGVGFVQRNTGNAAQEWEAAAGSPAPNLVAIQQMNGKMLDPSRAPSTERYYTRKLARDIFMNRGSSPEARQEAHNALRFHGAPSGPSSATGDDWWNGFFKRNQNNNFGEGTGEHVKDALVNEPGGGSRFRYLTDLS